MFWGHQPHRDGGIGAGCLSQWWPAEFVIDGVTYRTAEHWMMAAKARLFGDEAMTSRIIAARHPGEAKRLGKDVAGFDDDTWVRHRFDIVVAGNAAKFGQNPALRAYLLATGGRILVEASPVDRVWGIGIAAGDERAVRPTQWRGLNLLGFALMRVRAHLAQSTEHERPSGA
jgi:ribA/ribD-fused uncharacterized protein